MEIIKELPRTSKMHDAIRVVVDKLTTVAHFVAIKSNHRAIDIAYIFMKEIFRLHEKPKKIILY